MGSPGLQSGTVKLPGRATLEAEEPLPGFEGLEIGRTTASSGEGGQPVREGAPPEVEARGGRDNQGSGLTEHDFEKLRGRGVGRQKIWHGSILARLFENTSGDSRDHLIILK